MHFGSFGNCRHSSHVYNTCNNNTVSTISIICHLHLSLFFSTKINTEVSQIYDKLTYPDANAIKLRFRCTNAFIPPPPPPGPGEDPNTDPLELSTPPDDASRLNTPAGVTARVAASTKLTPLLTLGPPPPPLDELLLVFLDQVRAD